MNLLYILLILVISISTQAQELELLSTQNPKVVAVAKRLNGNWLQDNALLKLQETREDVFGELKFELDNAVAVVFNELYKETRTPVVVYVAGKLDFFGREGLFALLEIEGKPALMYFLDKPSKAAPSELLFNIELAVGEKLKDDVLYLEPAEGYYQPSYAFRRKVLKCDYSKENIVATHLIGTWQRNDKLGASLSSNKPQISIIRFESDSSILETIPFKYQNFFDDKTIYLAGRMTIDAKVYPFLLTVLNGNPHIIFFQEKNGVPMADAESFNLFVAVGDKATQDILLLGGDFNNQAFYPFKRK